MEFFSEGQMAFSGSSISFISDGSVAVVKDRIELNSGGPDLRPSKVNLQ